MMITGQPGTGKTLVVNSTVNLFSKSHPEHLVIQKSAMSYGTQSKFFEDLAKSISEGMKMSEKFTSSKNYLGIIREAFKLQSSK